MLDLSGFAPATGENIAKGEDLDLSPQLCADVVAIGKATTNAQIANDADTPTAEIGFPLDYSGEGGVLARSGPDTSTVSGGSIPGQVAGNAHGHGNLNQGPSMKADQNGGPSDERSMSALATRTGQPAIAIVAGKSTEYGGAVAAFAGVDGSLQTREYGMRITGSGDTQACVLIPKGAPAPQGKVIPTPIKVGF